MLKKCKDNEFETQTTEPTTTEKKTAKGIPGWVLPGWDSPVLTARSALCRTVIAANRGEWRCKKLSDVYCNGNQRSLKHKNKPILAKNIQY